MGCWPFYLLGTLQNLQFLIPIPDGRALKCWRRGWIPEVDLVLHSRLHFQLRGASSVERWLTGEGQTIVALFPNFSFWTETSLPWSGLRRLNLDLCIWKQQWDIGPVVEAATRSPGGCEPAVAGERSGNPAEDFTPSSPHSTIQLRVGLAAAFQGQCLEAGLLPLSLSKREQHWDNTEDALAPVGWQHSPFVFAWWSRGGVIILQFCRHCLASLTIHREFTGRDGKSRSPRARGANSF